METLHNTHTFAVIETGGKQYKVAPGDIISVEKIDGDFKPGDTISFENVLLSNDGSHTTFGAPFIDGVKVTAEFQEAGRAKKISVLRFRSKSRYHRKYGHRQPYTRLKITSIV